MLTAESCLKKSQLTHSRSIAHWHHRATAHTMGGLRSASSRGFVIPWLKIDFWDVDDISLSCLTFLCHWLWFCIWGPKYAKTAHLEIHKYIDAVCTYLEPSNPLHWHNKPSVTLPDRNARMIFNLQSYKNLAFLWHYIDIDSRQQQQRCPWEDQDDELSEAAHDDDDNSTMIQQHQQSHQRWDLWISFLCKLWCHEERPDNH